MVAAPDISPCNEAEGRELLRLLDEEFVFSRGRTLSLRDRFPAAFSDPRTTLIAGRAAGRISSGLMIRPFEWNGPAGTQRAAMIGLVYTRPELRGTGHGSALLAAAAGWLRTRDCEFAVLWTSREAFYSRHGWRSADRGLMCRYDTPEFATVASDEVEDSALWELHRAYAQTGVQTAALRFRTLLPHASGRDVFLHGRTYAVIGRDRSTGYVYELGGDPDGIPAIWKRIAGAYATVFVNVERDSDAHRRLRELPGFAWQEQRLAMWLPIKLEGNAERFDRLYIPFLDRV